jgi:hypothetical protein
METRKSVLTLISFVFLFFLGVSGFGAPTVFASNVNKVEAGKFIVEPPTLICLGFEWNIKGDDNRNATVEVSYRKKGDRVWKKALPLFRIQNEKVGKPPTYVCPNMFAGSIFDLEPDAEYECRFHMSDPDGVIGQANKTATVRTRAEPMPFKGGRIFHVYPAFYKGPKQEPAFKGLNDALRLGQKYTRRGPNSGVQPGDTILVHAGLYKDDRYLHTGATGVGYDIEFFGTYWFTNSGTREKPIVIKAAGDGEVIFDGDGCAVLFDVTKADYMYFEGLTLRNADTAILAGISGPGGCTGLTVKKCRIENVGQGIYANHDGGKNFYIADNVIIGRHDPNVLMGWAQGGPGTGFAESRGIPYIGLPGFPRKVGGPGGSENGITVYGRGHVVCYNSVSNFFDGIDHDKGGEPDGTREMPVSVDIYNNDISNISDNAITADGGTHNLRVFRNRCLNIASPVLSGYPTYGGPVYFIRNIVYHAPRAGALKWFEQTTGCVAYHNTFPEVGFHDTDGKTTAPPANVHFRNNLFVGEQGTYNEVFFVDTSTNYSSSDYNGFRPNEGDAPQFVWNSPPYNIRANFTSNPDGAREERKFRTLKEYSQATGQDKHSILVNYDIFLKVANPELGPKGVTRVYKPEELDFRLRPDAVAVDAGCILPNVNDGFTGKAPDLGAIEVGGSTPHYGPRP